MSRSPLAYPLARGIDGDSGGAADLQTDIMRFMAILSLCLVAIFALVQSIPMIPDAPPEGAAETPMPAPAVVAEIRVATPDPKPRRQEPVEAAKPAERLLRPAPVVSQVQSAPVETASKPVSTGPDGFTLRFESDLALTRLVAAGKVGFFAIAAGRAQRMSVGQSRISFWSASTPDSFHEMDASTVPKPVVEALTRAGVEASSVDWGVTLPGKLSEQLAGLMQSHSGGALVIGMDGSLALEES